MHSFCGGIRNPTDAVRTGFMPGSSALMLNPRAFSVRDEGNRIDGLDKSACVIVAHDQGHSCHRLFSDTDVIFDCHG
jgi:hypothetical protein